MFDSHKDFHERNIVFYRSHVLKVQRKLTKQRVRKREIFTKAICPLSVELIVLSMLVLKLHLNNDIKDCSAITSKSGKDLLIYKKKNRG